MRSKEPRSLSVRLKNTSVGLAAISFIVWWGLGFPSIADLEAWWKFGWLKLAAVFWYWFIAGSLMAGYIEKRSEKEGNLYEAVMHCSGLFTIGLVVVAWYASPWKA